jgi:hypothetical protein
MGNRKKLPHHEELTRLRVMTENQFTEKKLLRHAIEPMMLNSSVFAQKTRRGNTWLKRRFLLSSTPLQIRAIS